MPFGHCHCERNKACLCGVPLVCQVDRMLPGVLAESDMGPGFAFREYSFLDNPMVPPEVG